MICRVCGADMVLDALVAADARRALDPGQPAPVVMKCRNGHTERLDTGGQAPPPATFRPPQRCAMCGVEIPRQRGAAPRKSCGPEHKRFIEIKRAEAQAAHNRLHRLYRRDAPFVPFRFLLEAQPWYRGAATAFRPLTRPAELLIPTGPLFPEIPASWLEGFRRLYPVIEAAPAALPAIFPLLEEDEAGAALVFKTRRYRRRPRPELTPEQLMPYPVREA